MTATAILSHVAYKACSKCNEVKPISDFHNDRRKKSGLAASCKACHRLLVNAHYHANKEYHLAKNAKWSQNNKESEARRNKAYREKAKEKISARLKNRYDSDPMYQISRRVGCLIRSGLTGVNSTKRARTVSILGCDLDFFKRHLEKQFTKGMSWSNRGDWHLDHVVPIASAKTESDVLALNHFTNLRPVWAKDNLTKGASRIYLV